MCGGDKSSNTQIKTLVVNSADRISGTSDSFVVSLPQSLESIVGVRLLNVQLPNSLYNITTSNNAIVFTVGATTYEAEVDPGAYTTSTLKAALEAAMNAEFANAFTVTFNEPTITAIISGTAAFTLNWSTSTINSVLGFGTSDSASATSHTGENAYNLGFPTPIYVKINELSSPLMSTDGYDYLFCIQVDVNSIQFVNYNINTNFVQEHALSVSGLSRLTVSLKSQGNVAVDLQNLDWNMTLQFVQRRPN